MASALDACVANAARELGIPERDAREIVERIEALRRKKAAEGALDRLDEQVRGFARSEAEKARIAAALKRKQTALNVVLRDAWEQDLARLKGQGLDAREAIMAKLVGSYASVAGARKSASARRIALEADWLRGVAREVEAEAPGVLELLRRPKSAKPLLDAVVREVAELKDGGNPGRTGSPTARKVAEVLARYAEASRLEANRAGADIGRLDGWAGPQRHDAAKLLKAGRDAWVATFHRRWRSHRGDARRGGARCLGGRRAAGGKSWSAGPSCSWAGWDARSSGTGRCSTSRA